MELTTPLVSVLMITYNHEQYIRQALESVFIQKTDFEFEVVIGEDCSTDGTRSIIKEFEAKYPDKLFPIYHDVNVGMVRNIYEFCYSKLRGDYVAILEGDDYWVDEFKLQSQADFLTKNNEYVIVANHAYVLRESSEINEIVPSMLLQRTFSFRDVLSLNFIPSATVMFRMDKLGDFNLINREFIYDRILWLMLLSKGKGYLGSAITATYRRTGLGEHSRNSIYKNRLRAFHGLRELISDLGFTYKLLINIRLIRLRFQLIRLAAVSGDRSLLLRSILMKRGS